MNHPHDAEKELRKAQKRARMDAREFDDNTSCVNVAMGLSFSVAILWILPMFFGSWYIKQFFGGAVQKADVYVSLQTFRVELECNEARGVDVRMCHAIKKFGEEMSLVDFRDRNCKKVSKVACDLAKRLYMGTWIPALALPTAAIFQVLASLMLAIYWYMSHKERDKSAARSFAGFAMVTGMWGIIAWMLVTPNFKALPYEWANAYCDNCVLTARSSLFGMAENQVIPFGNACIGAGCALVGSFCAAGGFMYAPVHHLDESAYDIEPGYCSTGEQPQLPGGFPPGGPPPQYPVGPMPPNYGAIPMEGSPIPPGYDVTPMQGGRMSPGMQQPGMPMPMM